MAILVEGVQSSNEPFLEPFHSLKIKNVTVQSEYMMCHHDVICHHQSHNTQVHSEFYQYSYTRS